MKKIIFKGLLIFIIPGLTMCTDPNIAEIKLEENQVETFDFDQEINFNGNYLEYTSPEVFEQTLLLIRNSEHEELMGWLAQSGFESIHSIYVRALSDQNDLISDLKKQFPLEEYTENQLNQMEKPQIVQSSFIRQHSHLFEMTEDGLITGMKIFHSEIARLVNKDGIIKVAGHIFQYNSDNIKIILQGDESKIALLESTYASNEDLGIIVNPVETLSNGKSNENGKYGDNYRTWTTSGGGRRVHYWAENKRFSSPIYGDRVCEDLDDGCDNGDPLTKANNAGKIAPCPQYCYYPIIGYNYTAYVEIGMYAQNKFLWWWTDFRPYRLWMPYTWNKCGYQKKWGANDETTFLHADTFNDHQNIHVVYSGPCLDNYGFVEYKFYYVPSRGYQSAMKRLTGNF